MDPRDPRHDRRSFLRGAGAFVALPAFESLLPRASATSGRAPKAKRFVCVAPDYGVVPGSFFPAEEGADYGLPTLLKPVAKHRREFSVFSHLDHPGVGGGHACSATLLNGVKVTDVAGDRQRLVSLDQVIAGRIGSGTRFPSLRTGQGAPISYTPSGVPVPSIRNPENLFRQLFVEDHPKIKAARRGSLGENRSILDAVLQDANALGKTLAVRDRKKLDEYLTSVREAERKLRRREEWIDSPKPKAKVRTEPSDEDEGTGYPYDMALSYELITLALQTDSSRVITYQMPGGNRRFEFAGVTLGYHTLSHHGKQPDKVRQLEIIESYYVRHFSGFLDQLKKVRDAEGRPLLESTIVLFGSGMGNASSHSSRDLPILLAGGGFRHGRHHRFERGARNGMPLSNLFVTLLQQLGIEKDRFAGSTGNLNGVLL